MKKVLLLMLFSVITGICSYAYVIICPFEPGSSAPRHNCLRVNKVNLNGQYVEADCDNYDPPAGWFKHGCEN